MLSDEPMTFPCYGHIVAVWPSSSWTVPPLIWDRCPHCDKELESDQKCECVREFLASGNQQPTERRPEDCINPFDPRAKRTPLPY
jgi:hypothetical protein